MNSVIDLMTMMLQARDVLFETVVSDGVIFHCYFCF